MASHINSILKELYQKGKLGPLYIIRPPILLGDDQQSNPNHWVSGFFCEIIAHLKKLPLDQAKELERLGVSDLYHIKKDKDHKEYKVEEDGVLEFIKAHSYPPLEHPYKIIAVHEAEAISEKIMNKWLKTLEEPIKGVVTLFLASSNKPLLQTIESRAITLRLPPIRDDKQTWAPHKEETFPEYLARLLKEEGPLGKVVSDGQNKNLKKFIKEPQRSHFLMDSLKGSRSLQKELSHAFQSYAQVHCQNPRFAEQWIRETRWFEEAAAYNNAPQERFLGLLQLVQGLHH